MLQYLGAGNVAVFIDVADNKNRNALRLGDLHHGHSAVFHLRYAAGGGIIVFVVQGLDGIDDQNIRFHLVHGIHNVRKPSFGKNVQLFRRHPKPLRP